MGVDTKVLLTNPPDVLDLLRYTDETYKRASLRCTGSGAYQLQFADDGRDRILWVCPPGVCASDYADVHTGPAILISMGCWGNSEAIARRMAVKWGGMIMPNDCEDDWQNVHGAAGPA